MDLCGGGLLCETSRNPPQMGPKSPPPLSTTPRFFVLVIDLILFIRGSKSNVKEHKRDFISTTVTTFIHENDNDYASHYDS